MFYVMDKDTNEVIATTRFEHAANTIAIAFGVENCIVRYAESGNLSVKPIFATNK